MIPTIDSLRSMQDDRVQAFFGRTNPPRMGSMGGESVASSSSRNHPNQFFQSSNYYPNAAESSAKDLFRSMSAMGSSAPSMGGGNGMGGGRYDSAGSVSGGGGGMIPDNDEYNDFRQQMMMRMMSEEGRGGGIG